MLTQEVVDRARKRVGTTLCGKWRLDRVLGVGGMASVYAATHRNRKRVAIKLLHPELSIDEGIRSRFLREGYVANTIGHPGAVSILDDDVSEDGAAFLVMELLEGESLEERAARKGGRLSLREAFLVADQVLDVLDEAHEKSIIHRDIKPDNLFITRDGRVKVLDFGIARLRRGGEGSTRVGSFMGTPAYSAPEQARGRWNEVDGRSDLFALGATLFYALTGRPVHEAETPSEQLAMAIGNPAPRLRSVEPEILEAAAEIVDRALAYEKEGRWQSATEMQEAIRVILDQVEDMRGLTEPPVPIPTLELDALNLNELSATSITAHGDDPNQRPSSTTTKHAFASARRVMLGAAVAAGMALLVGLTAWRISEPRPASALEATRDVAAGSTADLVHPGDSGDTRTLGAASTTPANDQGDDTSSAEAVHGSSAEPEGTGADAAEQNAADAEPARTRSEAAVVDPKTSSAKSSSSKPATSATARQVSSRPPSSVKEASTTKVSAPSLPPPSDDPFNQRF